MIETKKKKVTPDGEKRWQAAGPGLLIQSMAAIYSLPLPQWGFQVTLNPVANQTGVLSPKTLTGSGGPTASVATPLIYLNHYNLYDPAA